VQNLVDGIVELLDEKKAESIQVHDMKDSDYYVDSVILATTISSKHGAALKDYAIEYLKSHGEKGLHFEESDDWTIIDTGDMLIHLMSSEYRSMYNLEEFLEERKKEKKID
jgi:ribosome silencing factor RsfS/YbeB/iojap